MQRSKVLWPAPSRVAGTVILAFCSYVPLTNASVVVDNTGDLHTGNYVGFQMAQAFTMPSYGGNISSLALVLTGSGSSEVYLYDTTSGVPNTEVSDLGSITGPGIATAAVSVGALNSSYSLVAGDTYAIVMQTTSAWSYTAGGSSGDGTLGSISYFDGSNWTQLGSDAMQMNLQVSPVPEVPATGVVMSLGALVIGLGHNLRRKSAELFPAPL